MNRTTQSTKTELIEDLAAVRRKLENLERLSARTEQAEDELARFFAHSPDLLCIVGFDGYFKRLNPAWTTRLGWTPAELEAKPFLDFVHPDDREATRAEVDRLAGGGEMSFENRYRHQDGSYHCLRWNARPEPRRRRIYATARDVTRQERLEAEVPEIVEREQERLGRELHDGLCQTLAGIAALSSTLSRRLAGSSESAASAAAAEITGLLNEAIGEARDLARGLGPAGLGGTGLDEALDAFALGVRRLFGVSCTLECARPLPRLPPEVKAHLFRIAQEAVSNAVTHGRAEGIEISLSGQDGRGLLCIRDNGVGLPEAPSERAGTGLDTMAYRARLIGASLDVRRRAPRGTAITCAFSLPETPDTREDVDHGPPST